MAAFGILRQYNDDYLREIGQPGTRGRPVFGIRGGQYVGFLRAEFETTAKCHNAGESFSVPFVANKVGGNVVEWVGISASADEHFSIVTRTRSYNMRLQGTAPSPFGLDPSFQLVGEDLVEIPRDAGDPSAGSYYYLVILYAGVDVYEIYQPWWGELAQAPAAGYAAPEGRWALRCQAFAAVRVYRYTDPDYPYDPHEYRIGASSGYFWMYSKSRFHRLRTLRRDFDFEARPEFTRSYQGISGPEAEAVADELETIAWSSALDGEYSLQITGASAPY